MLFCSLTGDQRDLYRAYLSSEEVQDILNVRTCSTDCVHGNQGEARPAQMLLLLVPWTGPVYLPRLTTAEELFKVEPESPIMRVPNLVSPCAGPEECAGGD